jgi:hypothetical protein
MQLIIVLTSGDLTFESRWYRFSIPHVLLVRGQGEPPHSAFLQNNSRSLYDEQGLLTSDALDSLNIHNVDICSRTLQT